MDSQATIRAPRGGQGLDQKELRAMPRWFTRNDSWDFGGKPSPTEVESGDPKSRKRRLATTFVFTIVFFAGASLAAVAGNRFQASIAGEDATAVESTTTTDSAAEAAPAAEESAAPAVDDSAAAAATAAAASHDLSAPAASAAATPDIAAVAPEAAAAAASHGVTQVSDSAVTSPDATAPGA